jgi:hypothetical protein
LGELAQDFFRARQRFCAQFKIVASALFLAIDEPGPLQDLQVLGYGGEGYRHTFGEIADAAPFARDPAQQLAPAGARQGSKDGVRIPPFIFNHVVKHIMGRPAASRKFNC